jgi:hypothetical protein
MQTVNESGSSIPFLTTAIIFELDTCDYLFSFGGQRRVEIGIPAVDPLRPNTIITDMEQHFPLGCAVGLLLCY